MRKDILKYCKGCSQFAKHRVGEERVHRTKPSNLAHNQWNLFPWIWLVNSTHHHQKETVYALTAVCMLTNFMFCIPLKNKSASEIVTAWRNHITFPFGVSRKMLTGQWN